MNDHRSPARTSFRLNAKALIQAGASDVLMVDPSSFGAVLSLAPEESGGPMKAQAAGTVAMIRIDGPLAQQARHDLCAYVDGYDAIAARFARALSDVSVDALVVVVNSPGGDAAGVEEATRRMQVARDRSEKPVLVYVDEMAASAAYWIACGVASDGIFGPAVSRVGSIGAISAVVDETEALRMEGIAVQLIREPEGKAEGHPAQPLTELATTRARERVKELGSRFYAHVAACRGLDPKDVRALDAAMFTGAEAKRRGLLNEVKSLESVVALAADLGRKARSKREKSRMDEKEQARLQAFEKSALESTGAKSSVEALGKIEGMKVELEAVRAKATTLEAFKAQAEAEAKAREATELVAIVDAAVADGRLRPAKRDSFLEKARANGGKAFAQAALEDREPEPAVSTGEKGGSVPIVAAKVPSVDAATSRLFAKVGLTEADFEAAKADGVV